jgi:hypothetical protein
MGNHGPYSDYKFLRIDSSSSDLSSGLRRERQNLELLQARIGFFNGRYAAL